MGHHLGRRARRRGVRPPFGGKESGWDRGTQTLTTRGRISCCGVAKDVGFANATGEVDEAAMLRRPIELAIVVGW